MKKKHLIPALAILTFVLGTASMMLPFLPFGWALYALTVLLLMPYFKSLRKAFKWLAKKDGTGAIIKAGYKVARLYRWAESPRLANKIAGEIKEAEALNQN